MDIKINAKPKGIPTCEIACAPGEHPNGAPQVTMFLKSIDAHGLGDSVGRINLSPAEARALAGHLVRAADRAEPPVGRTLDESVWAHKDGTAHSATGPAGCFPCANLRRAAING